VQAVITNPQPRTSKDGTLADVLLGIAPLLIGAQLLGFIFFIPAALQGHSSFRQLYTAGYMMRTGHAHELYDYNAQKTFQDHLVSSEPTLMPFIRPPFDALAYAPLSLLPYRLAFVASLLLNIVFLTLTLFALRLHTPNLRIRSRWLPAAIIASFVPVGSALMMGQDSIALLALLSGAMIALGKKKDGTAGILAGLGLFKFHIVIPLALLLLYWRRFRFFLAFTGIAITLLALSLWIAGPGQLKRYAASLLSIGQGASGTRQLLRYPLPVTMMPNIHGLVAGTVGQHIPPAFAMVITGVVAAGVLVWVAVALPRRCSAHWAVPVAITASTLASYYLFVYDLPVLLLPLALVTNSVLTNNSAKPEWLTSFSCVALLLAPAVLLFFGSYFYLVSLFVLFFLIVLVRNAKNDCSERATAICP
jgi:glycosyl transferase family 87